MYASLNNIWATNSRRMKWVGHIARVGREERCTQGFGGETRRKEPLGRPRRRWEYDIKIDFQ